MEEKTPPTQEVVKVTFASSWMTQHWFVPSPLFPPLNLQELSQRSKGVVPDVRAPRSCSEASYESPVTARSVISVCPALSIALTFPTCIYHFIAIFHSICVRLPFYFCRHSQKKTLLTPPPIPSAQHTLFGDLSARLCITTAENDFCL